MVVLLHAPPFKDGQSPDIVIFEVVSDNIQLAYAGSNRILLNSTAFSWHNGDRPPGQIFLLSITVSVGTSH
jgi:hypothetical protein